MINIIEYVEDRKHLISLVEELQDYLTSLDPLKRLRTSEKYGKLQIDDLYKQVIESCGKIYVAKDEDKIVGMIVGIIELPSESDESACIPTKRGSILELIVNKAYRNQNIGSLLMKEMENYFKLQGCDIIRIGLLTCNIKAHKFYQKQEYQDRMIYMIKKISKE